MLANFQKTIRTRISDRDTITETTTIYPGKPSWGRKPNQIKLPQYR